MVDTNMPFVLYADCEVIYSGRAESQSERGYYLIIHKSDGTLLIHNSIKNPPMNYQGPGAKLKFDDNILIATRKSETIKVILYDVISYMPLYNWSKLSISIAKTEKDLVMKLFDNWFDYFDVDLEIIYLEYQTNLGPIDFLGVDTDNIYHIVEAKRGTASLGHCSQLKRYLESLSSHTTVGYVASPKISKRALEYLQKNNCKWLKIEF